MAKMEPTDFAREYLDLGLQPYQRQILDRVVGDLAISMGRSVREMEGAIVNLTVSMRGATARFREAGRYLAWVGRWKDQHYRLQTYGMVRPNGKLRRSGRRHKGMPAWRGKYA